MPIDPMRDPEVRLLVADEHEFATCVMTEQILRRLLADGQLDRSLCALGIAALPVYEFDTLPKGLVGGVADIPSFLAS